MTDDFRPSRRKASTISAEERVRENMRPTDSGCWEWLSTIGNHGYGVVVHGARLHLAHRFAYETLVGPIPEGLTIDHLCQNRRCVNPSHMEPVTRAENARRGEKNRKTRSSGRWMAHRTECVNGHPYVEGSYRMWRGARICKICARANRRRFRERTGR